MTRSAKALLAAPAQSQSWQRGCASTRPWFSPNHVETVIAEVDVDGERHLVKLSRYFDNAQFWTIPGEHDERLRRRKTMIVTEPEPDEYELYDLTADPLEQRNLAHPSYTTESSRRLQREMLRLLADQLASKRLVPATGVVPGYQPPNAA
jgi:hypothetical protein